MEVPFKFDQVISDDCRRYCQRMRNGEVDRCHITSSFCPNDDPDVSAIIRTLQENPQITDIELFLQDISNSSRAIISNFLAGRHGVKRICIFDGGCGTPAPEMLDGVSQGSGVQSLELKYCDISASASALLRLLRSPAAPKKLVLFRAKNDFSEEDVEVLVAACLANESVQELECQESGSPRLIACLTLNLKVLRKVHLKWCSPICSHLVELRQTLQELVLELEDMSQEDCEHLSRALRVNPCLRNLKLTYTHAQLGNVSPVLCLLQTHCLQQLALEYTHLSHQDCQKLIAALRENQFLKSLALLDASVVDDARVLVADMIQAAGSLEKITVEFCSESMGWDSLVQSLHESTHLRELTLCNDGGLGTLSHGLGSLLARLPHLRRLVLKAPHMNTLERLTRALSVNRTLLELKIEFKKVDKDAILDFMDRGILRNSTLKSLQCELDFWHSPRRLPTSVIPLLCQNLSLTEISLGGRTDRDRRHDEAGTAHMLSRNLALERLDYGVHAAPKLWPEMIQLFLRRHWVGPSLVFRLLTHRSEVLERGSDG